MAIKISSGKAKGRQLQQWVCQKIADLFKIKYNQQDDNCLVHSREGGQPGTDIILRGNLYKNLPFDIECKRTEKLKLYQSIEQAKKNTKPERWWMLVHKKNRTDPIVIISWDAFEYLLDRGDLFL